LAQDGLRTLTLRWRWLRSVPTAATAQIALSSPSWKELTPQERQILAPLAPTGTSSMRSGARKWRGIAQRYPSCSPTRRSASSRRCAPGRSSRPEQRQAARERYRSLHQLPPDKKEQVAREVAAVPDAAARAPPRARQPAGAAADARRRRAPAPARTGSERSVTGSRRPAGSPGDWRRLPTKRCS
jgi:hypothetical protein